MIYNAVPIFCCQVSLCFVFGSVLCKKRKIHKNILQCFVLKQRHFLLFFSPYILPTWLFWPFTLFMGKMFFCESTTCLFLCSWHFCSAEWHKKISFSSSNLPCVIGSCVGWPDHSLKVNITRIKGSWSLFLLSILSVNSSEEEENLISSVY